MPADRSRVALRPARPADREALVAVHDAAVRGLASDAYAPDQLAAWASADGPASYPIGDDAAHVTVAEGEGAPSEIAGFGWIDLEAGEVRAVYVLPDRARQGVGRSIVARLESAARVAGRESLSVYASVNAAPFYERLGYDPHSEIEHAIQGVRLECVYLRKELASDAE